MTMANKHERRGPRTTSVRAMGASRKPANAAKLRSTEHCFAVPSICYDGSVYVFPFFLFGAPCDEAALHDWSAGRSQSQGFNIA